MDSPSPQVPDIFEKPPSKDILIILIGTFGSTIFGLSCPWRSILLSQVSDYG